MKIKILLIGLLVCITGLNASDELNQDVITLRRMERLCLEPKDQLRPSTDQQVARISSPVQISDCTYHYSKSILPWKHGKLVVKPKTSLERIEEAVVLNNQEDLFDLLRDQNNKHVKIKADLLALSREAGSSPAMQGMLLEAQMSNSPITLKDVFNRLSPFPKKHAVIVPDSFSPDEVSQEA